MVTGCGQPLCGLEQAGHRVALVEEEADVSGGNASLQGCTEM